MEDFVYYLDLYRRNSYITYLDAENVFNSANSACNNHCLENNTFSPESLGDDLYFHYYKYYNYSSSCIPTSINSNCYYTSQYQYPNMYQGYLSYYPNNYELENNMQVESDSTNLDTDIIPAIIKQDPISAPLDTNTCLETEPPLSEKKTRIYIQVDIQSIANLIDIIQSNPYDPEFEYNINLKSLHLILPELVELDAMIGMQTLKISVLNQLIYYIQELHIDSESGHCDYKHTVISGPPGTGKTEVAKLIGKMYAKVGILKKNVFKKVTRADLVAGYLGQTAIKTKAVIAECMGGCLFIDEAYSLASYGEIDSFSKECIDTLCEALSDCKNDMMVIIAGYEHELNETFFRANRGLESRFIWRFKIDSYSAKELMDIFAKKVKSCGWEFESPTTISLKWFESKKKYFVFFGRDIESLFSHIKINHSRRIYGKDPALRKKISKLDIDTGFDIFIENVKKSKDANIPHGLYI